MYAYYLPSYFYQPINYGYFLFARNNLGLITEFNLLVDLG